MAGLHTLRVSDESDFEAASFAFCVGAQHPPKAGAPAWQNLQFLTSAFRFLLDSTRAGSVLARFFEFPCRKDPV